MYKRKLLFPVSVNYKRNSWLPLYLSLILIILTFFVALTSFSVRIGKKMRLFQKSYRESFVFIGGKSKGKLSILNIGDADRLNFIINQMRENGLNENLMKSYLKETDLISLGIAFIESGNELVFPVSRLFKEGGTSIEPTKYFTLIKILPLIKFLPYFVLIEGYPDGKESDKLKAYEVSAKRAYSVYKFFVSQGVSERKMAISAYGISNDERKDSIRFKFMEEE